MILSNTKEERQAAVDELFPFVKKSIKGTLEAMDGLPVTIRLLDPPLHEFVPQDKEAEAQLAKALNIKPADIKKRGEALHEINPMMGHRGIRLGDHLSRSDRDADPGHLRGGRRADQGRQGRQARDHGPRDLRRQGTRRHQGDRRSRARRGEGRPRAST